MVLLGGVQTLLGPVVGAVVFTALQDEVLRHTEYWRLVLGAVVLVIVLAFPAGIVGSVGRLLAKRA
jgi:branched-chain amino acid transport system permease protein